MKWKKWLEDWDMTELRINAWFLDMTWSPKEADRSAAWELYIELLTRTTTQTLGSSQGMNKAALESVYYIFPLTREILKKYGSDSLEFSKIAVVVLNQVIRPFTSKWHKLLDDLEGDDENSEFRRDLTALQKVLINYTKMLGNMAGIEQDLTRLESD